MLSETNKYAGNQGRDSHMRLGDTQLTAPAAVVLKCRYWPAASRISAAHVARVTRQVAEYKLN